MCASASCTVHGSRAAGRWIGRFQSAGVSRETTRSRRANSRCVRSTTSLRVCAMVRGASYRMATVTRYRRVEMGEDLGNDGHPLRGKRLNVRGVVGTCQSSGRMSVGPERPVSATRWTVTHVVELVVRIDVFLMILVAALVHAAWNALIKADGDRLALITVMSSTQVGLSLCLVPFVTVPAQESWPYLLGSSALNTGYMLSLNRAYQVGDLSLVYPFARGTAPLLVAVISIGLLREPLSHANDVGILLISLGVTSQALTHGLASGHGRRPVLCALATGACIARSEERRVGKECRS